jgi:hypothetical protein
MTPTRKMVWSISEGGAATIELPEMGLESLDELEEAVVLMFRSARRQAEKADAKDAGSLEYASWFNAPAIKEGS